MQTKLTREDAIALLRKYNKEPFHILHGLTVGGVLKWYANELGYDIDEMATLALYNRISNIQRLDEPTNLTEVKEIVDEAVARAEKVGFKKMFDIITSRRYTEDDYIALREKDFDE